jgi:hypothetical protein
MDTHKQQSNYIVDLAAAVCQLAQDVATSSLLEQVVTDIPLFTTVVTEQLRACQIKQPPVHHPLQALSIAIRPLRAQPALQKSLD